MLEILQIFSNQCCRELLLRISCVCTIGFHKFICHFLWRVGFYFIFKILTNL